MGVVLALAAKENMLFMTGKFGRLIILQPMRRLIAVRIEVMDQRHFGGMQRNAKLRRHRLIITALSMMVRAPPVSTKPLP